jgi:hypothetical protein
MKLSAIVIALLLPSAWEADQKRWGPYRGANTPPKITQQDVKDFAALGGNLLRINGNSR